MPVIDLSYEELKQLSGLDKPADWFIDVIPMTGASYEGSEGGTLRFEFFPNRPDHYSVEGVARTLRSMYSAEGYLPEYPVARTANRIVVDDSVKKVRPVIVGALLNDLKFTDETLRSLIELQEKLHITVGRKRRKVAIGIHDVEGVTFPLKYAAYGGSDYSFAPLGHDGEMTLAEIIAKHEKGQEFGWIVGDGPFPLITDSMGKVLSMPPIINGNITQLTGSTKDVFVDVTGTSEEACSGVLNIITTALAERGGAVSDVVIADGQKETRSPQLARRSMNIRIREVCSLLGLKLDGQKISELLQRMGHASTVHGTDVHVEYPAYRPDIMHAVDLIEDAAISYGFENFGNSRPREQTVGSITELSEASGTLAELMVGYGYSQVVTFMISGRDFEFGRMKTEPHSAIDIVNPTLEGRDMLRTSLLPGMLLVLEANKHNELPQRIFEIGDVHVPESRRMFAAISIHPKADFAECKSLTEALNRDMNAGFRLAESHDPRFTEGRQMAIMLKEEKVGSFGELHPDVITNFNLYNPVVALEFDFRKTMVLR